MGRELAKSLYWSRGPYSQRLPYYAAHARFASNGHRSTRTTGILPRHQRQIREPQALGSLDIPYLALRIGHWSVGLLLDLCLVSAVHLVGFATLLYVLGNPFCIRPSSPRAS